MLLLHSNERVQSTVCSFIQSVKMPKYKELVETSKDQKHYVTATLCTLVLFWPCLTYIFLCVVIYRKMIIAS
jgi:hypothetical protein